MSSIRQKARIFRLKIIAKLFRSLILTIARLTIRDKPTPDLVEYIPSTSTPAPASTTTTTTTKPSDHKIKIHIYHPPTTPETIFSINNPTPVLITACGSGFITPGLGLDDRYCQLIAFKTNHTVIDVGYRVAPEDAFPAALEDIASVVQWVLSQPERFDTSRISIGGFSAGANLAASVAVNYFPTGTFWALVAFYPVFDAFALPGGKMAFSNMDMESRVPARAQDDGKIQSQRQEKTKIKASKPPFGGMASVPTSAMKFMKACYLANVWDGTTNADILKDPRVSPAYADVGRFPPRCLFVTAEYDCLAPEVEELAGKIKGVDIDGEERKVVVYRAIGCGHMFDKNVESGSEREKKRDEAYGLVVDMLKGN
ncbi:Alpha/Beta hydrolase protein [Aspergillus undulatus]|uniref:Alpha/Beta hydrolase protein n=1 Tax=Aspergillus undulatus TaxID=1810928 RepID=UPI003CCDE8B0